MRTVKYLFVISIVVSALASCLKIKELSPVPHIEFTSFSVFDTTDILNNRYKAGKLQFYFEDGDGDVGLETAESVENDTSNLFFTLFRKSGNTMVEVTDKNDLMKPASYRIPYMERTGQNKILKGTVSVIFLYTFYEPGDSNIIKYDFYITDRSDNTSNIVSTCEIPLSLEGIYKN
ncbi:MAG: hypothetical protein LLG13_04115 [Bacteroidales bacterium]|nr:hypothetical protein [Bacteroidales bacterium]